MSDEKCLEDMVNMFVKNEMEYPMVYDKLFRLQRVREGLDFQTIKDGWRARFFGGDWCFHENLKDAVRAALNNWYDKHPGR